MTSLNGFSDVRGAAGFYRVGKDGRGRWWFITPEGSPMFYRGVTSANRSGKAGGRRAAPGEYTKFVNAKYGTDAKPWVQSVINRLKSWQFNALGAWCEDTLFEAGLPYTDILDLQYEAPLINTSGIRVPDVFDEFWLENLDRVARTYCAPRRNSKSFIGYFTDNELGWGAPLEEQAWGGIDITGGRQQRIYLLQACLSLPADRGAHQAAWKFAEQRHGSLENIARAYGLVLTSRQDVASLTNEGQAINTAAYGEDLKAFIFEFAKRYFETTAEAIKRHDPNHLILGCRFGAPPGPDVFRACTPAVMDVLCANNYRVDMSLRVDEYHRPTGLPVLIGEYAWCSGYFTEERITENLPSELVLPGADKLPRMHARAKWGVPRAAANPALVGYTWYRWVDHPGHKYPDNYGLVTYKDEENTHHTALVTALNAQLEALHAGA